MKGGRRTDFSDALLGLFVRVDLVDCGQGNVDGEVRQDLVYFFVLPFHFGKAFKLGSWLVSAFFCGERFLSL